MRLVLSEASITKYTSGTPDSPQPLICKACPGESHEPLDCVRNIQRRCSTFNQEGVVTSRIGDVNEAQLGSQDSPQPLVHNASPGESHKPLDDVRNIQRRCSTVHQEGVVTSRIVDVNEDKLGSEDKPVAVSLTKKQLRLRQFKAKKQAQTRTAANLKYSGQANITAHVCQNKPEANIRMFRKSFIAWRNNSRKHLVAIVKFLPFATMEPSLKARYQHLAHHLIAQTAYQNPNNSNGPANSGKMFSLGWRKAYEEKTKIGITGSTEKVSLDRAAYEDLQTHVPTVNTFIGERFKNLSQPLYDEVRQQHRAVDAPGLAPHFERDPDGFTCHLSYTLGNFSNDSHTDRDASPFSFVTWLPINEKTGDLIEGDLNVSGGQFVFPRNGFGINFTGFRGVVECAWKATLYHHLTLPSSSSSSHSRLGYSCQLPKKTQKALQRMKNKFYEKSIDKQDWIIRDMAKILDDSFDYPKEPPVTKNKRKISKNDASTTQKKPKKSKKK
ncbi:hypothetical protein PSTG_00518 [Puccinia striiformis f. sp. tritici PST-78]|uniref:Tet-like 2OG-Fe(II) oxygenase domain-containing protein n=1 Tax=Puccinia striiformis f. sp. tritici PST-78 TaxID=1165861 RepID=A0A0L0W548_9BASI|nr:hypothetical protein PSTG_00518 [Puccinia striiformis f. sp. tritici PST-78]